MAIDPALAWTARLAAAAVLAAAGAAKLAAPGPFAGVVRNYRLLPAGLALPVAYAIPPAELALALALVLLPGSAWPALGAALLLAGFAAAMAVNLGRGRADIDCGCFAGVMRQRLSPALVARNAALAALLLLVAAGGDGGARPLVWLDGVTVAAAAGSLLLAWAAAGRLSGVARRA